MKIGLGDGKQPGIKKNFRVTISQNGWDCEEASEGEARLCGARGCTSLRNPSKGKDLKPADNCSGHKIHTRLHRPKVYTPL